MATQHPSPRYYTQNQLSVTVAKADNGQHYVHVAKTPGMPRYGVHPEFTPNEAEALARDISNAAADARRKNVAGRY